MFITSEVLKEYDACIEGQQWFARNFPNGATMMEVIKTPHVPLYFLHWGALHFDATPEEIEAYTVACHIQNCTSFFECSYAENSSYIDNSNHVTDSEFVFNSNHVKKSRQIQHSSQVEYSNSIINSTSIISSEWCVESQSIKKSMNVLRSNYIIGSHDIYSSSLVTDSSFVFESKDVVEGGFVNHCINVEHCLFCADCTDKQYMIFNHPVKPAQWNFIYDEYNHFIDGHHINLCDPWEPDAIDEMVLTHSSYIQFFKPFDKWMDEFMSWVKNLPYYDPMIAYQITFIPNFLQ